MPENALVAVLGSSIKYDYLDSSKTDKQSFTDSNYNIFHNSTSLKKTAQHFCLSSRSIGEWSLSGINTRGVHEKTAISSGSNGFVPFGDI